MKRSIISCFFIALSILIPAAEVEQYTVFELELKGPSGGNPFVDVQLSAEFKIMNRTYYCDGFYDGTGIYKVRFMPDEPDSCLPGRNIIQQDQDDHDAKKLRCLYQ